ncbi:uncharacterized membrane protein At3g27390-like [Impatiens glandulifera]|uniref:uncharacterized membrane protein At3g27390-like n=1 Tax=Impatiens glandulifera TaxID=253017 RepID=UPI001FB0A395|nr:uncharacterized membrane protein At3g27390-like [Impatiens glandulifera]XP_047310691.1 uncharacterized membrane protein At3g27390-like [Impatiens glandulifera]
MEPPNGFFSSLWNFICFLPYFIGLLILGLIKGVVVCPFTFVIMTIGNSSIVVGLWPVHFLLTYYSVLRCKMLGPVLKFVLCPCMFVILILWPLMGIIGSAIGGLAYGLLAPMFATFEAVGEGKTDPFFHCIYDGTWDTIKGSCAVVTDFKDVCFHSYFSFMDDIRTHVPQVGEYYEIRLLLLPGAILAGLLGILVDIPIISLIAILKSPYMLFKGWHRLFQDCIGREGPFLETICVPFAGLAILLWPLAVAGSVLGSMVSSLFLGVYAAVVVYQEDSLWLGLSYIVASISIYDEYSNDVLDMHEGSCFPRPRYQKKDELGGSRASSSFSKPPSFKNIQRTPSLKTPMLELKPLELLDSLFEECRGHGEQMVLEGLITVQDIEAANKSNKDSNSSKVISIGLPAYCLLQALFRSAKANTAGILLSDNFTEITSSNRPKDTIFDWFLNPLIVLKDQLRAENLSEEEEDYLGKLVILSDDPERMKKYPPPESQLRKAELDAFSRRLRGITKSVSRYPTFRRRFEDSVKSITDELAKKNESSTEKRIATRSKSALARIFSQKSFKSKTAFDREEDRDVEIA